MATIAEMQKFLCDINAVVTKHKMYLDINTNYIMPTFIIADLQGNEIGVCNYWFNEETGRYEIEEVK